MESWIIVTIVFVGLFIFVLYIGWGIGELIEVFIYNKFVKAFEKDYVAAVKHTQPTWEEIKNISSLHFIKLETVGKINQKTLAKILTGEEQDLATHKTLIKSYIDEYNKEVPFEGLPSDIRIHLERIQDNRSNINYSLSPLTDKIKELLVIKNNENKKLKFYTIAGFFIGLVGVGFSVYTYNVTDKISIKNLEKKDKVENSTL